MSAFCYGLCVLDYGILDLYHGGVDSILGMFLGNKITFSVHTKVLCALLHSVAELPGLAGLHKWGQVVCAPHWLLWFLLETPTSRLCSAVTAGKREEPQWPARGNLIRRVDQCQELCYRLMDRYV